MSMYIHISLNVSVYLYEQTPAASVECGMDEIELDGEKMSGSGSDSELKVSRKKSIVIVISFTVILLPI